MWGDPTASQPEVKFSHRDSAPCLWDWKFREKNKCLLLNFSEGILHVFWMESEPWSLWPRYAFGISLLFQEWSIFKVFQELSVFKANTEAVLNLQNKTTLNAPLRPRNGKIVNCRSRKHYSNMSAYNRLTYGENQEKSLKLLPSVPLHRSIKR